MNHINGLLRSSVLTAIASFATFPAPRAGAASPLPGVGSAYAPLPDTFETVLAQGSIFSVRQVADGGYVLGGQQQNPSTSFFDPALIKLGPAGELEWKRFFSRRP